MAVQIPTVKEIKTQILNNIASEFGEDVNNLGITYQVWASVQAAMIWVNYLVLSRVQKNIYYDTADNEVLLRYGQAILGRLPSPAVAGEYTMQVTGTIGAVIPASTQFRANDDTLAAGYLFIVDQEFTLTAETDSVPLRALTAGIESALFVDDLLTSTAPIANVESEAIILAITTASKASESIDSYREDIISSARIEPQGGSPGDFRLWSLDVPEVRTSYPFVKIGEPGTIEVYVEATKENTAPAEITGVPTQDTLYDVYKNDNNIETGVLVTNPLTGKGRKPISVFRVLSIAANPVPVDLEFTGLSDETVASTLRSALDDYLYEIRPFVAGADVITNKNDILTIGGIFGIAIQILEGTGITYTTLEMKVNGVTVNENQFLLGDYPYLRYINNDGTPI